MDEVVLDVLLPLATGAEARWAAEGLSPEVCAPDFAGAEGHVVPIRLV